MNEEKGISVTKNTTLTIHEDMEVIRERLENYMSTMHRKPHHKKVFRNQYANNASYLLVSNIEMDLDRLYLGLWEFLPHGAGAEVLVNSVVYNGVLRVFHPVANIWLSRAGVGAVDIQVDANGVIKAKGIQKAVGAAKTFAFKNAAKSLGKRYGRDLNRISGEDEANYERYYTQKPVTEDQGDD